MFSIQLFNRILKMRPCSVGQALGKPVLLPGGGRGSARSLQESCHPNDPLETRSGELTSGILSHSAWTPCKFEVLPQFGDFRPSQSPDAWHGAPHSFALPLSSPQQPLACFLSVDSPVLDISRTNRIVYYVIFWGQHLA